MARTLIGLGQAYELLYVENGSDKERVAHFDSSWWWAWDGGADTGRILLVKTRGALSRAVRPSNALHMHRDFHDAEPAKFLEVEAWENKPPLRTVGRVVAFAYDATSFSSSKRKSPYRHHFGSISEYDKPPFETQYWPNLTFDSDNHLAITRRPGNTFRLADWVIG